MPSIIIREIDNTNGGGSATDVNVVYVPGFTTSTDWDKDEKGGLITSQFPGKRIPTLCKTISSFENCFGKKPAIVEIDGEESIDKSYIYAKELLKLGLPVLYESINDIKDTDTPTEGMMYEVMQDDLYGIYMEDKGEYTFKYLTSGGYPVLDKEIKIKTTTDDGETETVETISLDTVALKMLELAETRGDCIALIDHQDSPSADLTGTNSVYGKIVNFAKTSTNAEFGAAFTPWVNVNCTTYKGTITMPPSFAYLSAFATSIKTNANWIAIAGATRGQIPNLDSDKPLNIDKILTNSIAEKEYQNRDGISINAITNIKPFGYRIWGNRTLKDNSLEANLTATSFLNIRNMICDVKKVVYDACKRFTFEQNNDILWVNFKAAIEPTLEKMKTGAGLSGYKIIKEPTTEKAKLKATIKLFPLYAVEDFEITVSMEDDEVSVS